MSKRKMVAQSDRPKKDPITGFIHNVSSIKRSRKSNLYFEAEIQTSKEDVRRLVCFSSEKHKIFQNAEMSKKAVTLTNANLSPSPKGDINVLVNKDTFLEMSAQNVTFRHCCPQHCAGETPPQQLIISLQTPSEMVSVIAKVLRIEKAESVQCYGKPVQMAEAIIADNSKQILLTLWDTFIPALEPGKTYTFLNLGTRMFQTKMKLTTTGKTVINPAEPLLNVVFDVPSPDKITTQLEFVSATSTTKCGSCRCVIPDENIQPDITECSTCGMMMKSSKLITTCIVKINVQNGQLCLTAFNRVVTKFLQENNQLDLLSSTKELCKYLIKLPSVCLYYEGNVISAMSICPLQESGSKEGSQEGDDEFTLQNSPTDRLYADMSEVD